MIPLASDSRKKTYYRFADTDENGYTLEPALPFPKHTFGDLDPNDLERTLAFPPKRSEALKLAILSLLE